MMNSLVRLDDYRTAYVPTPVAGDQEIAVATCLAKAGAALAKAKTVEDASQCRQQTKALEGLAKEFKLSKEIQLDATELRIRAERRIGEILSRIVKDKEGRPSEERNKKNPLHEVSCFPTLATLGITFRDSSNFQRLAGIPQETFESVITDCRVEAASRSIKALSTSRVLKLSRQSERGDRELEYSPLIKPSDNWNFMNVQYGRIDDSLAENWGYIPGELYANCFWYYVSPGEIVVAPMAGAGQVQRVYDDRAAWMGKHIYHFELKMFDLHPRGQYKALIGQNDLVEKFPTTSADYIIMDVPYFGMVDGQYSAAPEDLANMDFDEWQLSMGAIAKNCAVAQSQNKLCTVMSPNYRNVTTGAIFVVTSLVEKLWVAAGYTLHDKAYATRRIQQAQNPNMARMNHQAKARRVMLTDITEILTFRKN